MQNTTFCVQVSIHVENCSFHLHTLLTASAALLADGTHFYTRTSSFKSDSIFIFE